MPHGNSNAGCSRVPTHAPFRLRIISRTSLFAHSDDTGRQVLTAAERGRAGLDLSREPIQLATVPHEDHLQIEGRARLRGHAAVSGSKNAALALLSAALLARSEVTLRNVPDLVDVHTQLALLRSVGARAAFAATSATDGCVTIDASHLTGSRPCPRLMQQLRSSVLLTGPLLARTGEATIALPGGCKIGARPVDLHIKGLARMGAQIEPLAGDFGGAASDGADGVASGGYRLRLRDRLQGCALFLDFPSVGATETLLMAASVAHGESTISNAAMEPEIVELASMLNAMGARISGAGTSCIRVQPAARLNGTEWRVMPDRIETGTFLAAAAITGSSITVGPAVPSHISSVLSKLQAMGCITDWDASNALPTIHISTPEWPLRAQNVRALPYAGFPTDLQPQFTALLSVCAGAATVTDTVFESRMGHVAPLRALGADVTQLRRDAALVQGLSRPGRLARLPGGVNVRAPDLRAGAALVLAALAAEAPTEVRGVDMIDRGYAGLHGKLAALGAEVSRRSDGV